MQAKLIKIYRRKFRQLKRAAVLAMREFAALLHISGLRKYRYGNLVFSKTFVMKSLRQAKSYARETSLFAVRATAMALVAVLIFVPLLQAFEAHVINVTAVPIQIDPPVQNLPGPGTSWNDPVGAYGLTSPINVTVTENDPDATHIFYTFKNGTTTPEGVPDPVCGGPLGGVKSGSYVVYVPSNTVIKSIACDGTTPSAHHSVINTKIYTMACQPKSVNFDPAGPAVQSGGGNTSADNVLIDANTTVNGNVRSNHDIKAHASSSRNINGNAIAVGSIDSQFVVSGAKATGTAPSTLLDLQLPYWKDAAKAGGTISGNIVIPNSATTASLSLGPSEIMGNLAIGTNNNIILTGTVYVHGNISIHSNVKISQSSEYQDKLSMIIADGIIDVDSNVTFTKYGSSSNTGAFLLVSTHAAVSGNAAAVELNSNTKPANVGDVILFATNGDARVHSNNTVLGVYATHGTDSDHPAVTLDDHVVVAYRPVSGVIGCGKPFYASSNVVINEFMPDPVGSDSAHMPGGEWIELYNGTGTDKDLSGWVIRNIHNKPLFVTATNTDLSTTTIPSGGHLVVYRNGDSQFSISAEKDKLSLYNGLSVLVDSYEYDLPSDAPENKSFSRMPDGSANWIDPEPTPGEANETYIVDQVPPDLENIAFVYPDEATTTLADLAADVSTSTASSTGDVLAETSTSTQATTTEPTSEQASSTTPTEKTPEQPVAPQASTTDPVLPPSDPVLPPVKTEEPKPEVTPPQSDPAPAPTSTEPTQTSNAPAAPEAPAGQ